MVHQLGKAADEGTFESHNGLRIFYRSWQPPEKARGIVVIVPGFNSHSGYYAWVGEQLMAIGLAVFAIDLRGRGKSEGERFYVAEFADYVDDAARVVTLSTSRYPGLPVFVLGHSAGGVVSCLYALEHQAELGGCRAHEC